MGFVNPLTVPDWDEKVLASGSQCVFHSQAWARTLADSGGFVPCYITHPSGQHFDLMVPVMEAPSRILGPRGVSLPFTDYCDWIYPAQDNGDLLKSIIENGRSRQWRYLETRRPDSRETPTTEPPAFLKHELPLAETEATLWNKLDCPVRTAIRKAHKKGVRVSFHHDHPTLLEFYRQHCLTRRKQGIPPKPFLFFESLFKNMIQKGLGEIGLAQQKGVPLATAIYLNFGKAAFYKLGASDPSTLSSRGNHALMWEAICRFTDAGFALFSLGRTDTGNTGLRHFKLGWGCRESPLGYFRYDYKLECPVPAPFRAPSPFLRMALSHTPLTILQLLGQWLYPFRI